ncbi:MAG: sensor histidine kinase [Planctomycetaceae bacterium]
MSAFKAWKTLRFRLAMWNAGAMALTALIIIVSVHQATRRALVHRLDELLAQDAEEIVLAIRDLGYDTPELRDELDRKAIGHRRHEWFATLLDANHQGIWGSGNAPQAVAKTDSNAAARFHSDGNFRHFTLRIENGTPVRWLRVGASMEPLRQELERIDGIALTTWLLSLGVAPWLGWFLSGRALRPLRMMVQTASALRPNHLSERLPVRGAGDELDQLAGTVNSLLDRIATDVGQKQDFLANAAHALRTPLAAIRTTADVALVASRSEDEYRELLAQMMEQTEQLSGIVDQLLLLSESSLFGRSEMHTKFSLDQIVAKSADIFRAVAENNYVSLRVDRNDAIDVVGDRNQWIQVLNNLIENAIKYTPRGGRISIDLRLVNTAGSVLAQLTVSDTGIGIQADETSRIFDRFYRADRAGSKLTDVSGTGLGLSICRVVVEAHGGTIHCVSQPGQGSAFTIQLPLGLSP